MNVIGVPELLRPAIEVVIDMKLLDAPVFDLHAYREKTTEPDRAGLAPRLARVTAAIDDHRQAVALLDRGFLRLDVAVPFLTEALDFERDDLTLGARLDDGGFDTETLLASVERIDALEDLLARARFDQSRFGEPQELDDQTTDGEPTPIAIDPVFTNELRTAADRFVARNAEVVRDLLGRNDRDRDRDAEDAAVDLLGEMIELRGMVVSGSPIPRDHLDLLKIEVIEQADADGEVVDWSRPREVEARARRLAEIAELGTGVAA